VYFNSRSHVVYRDRASKIFVSAEMLAVPRTWAVFPEDVRVGSVDGPQSADEGFRQSVLERVRLAAQFLGITLEF
jgi:hypothetical protein